MLRSALQTRASATIVTIALVTLIAACDSGKNGSRVASVDVIPTAEAAPVMTPRTTVFPSVTADTAMPPAGAFELAEAAYNAKKYADAKEMFEEIVSRNPENGWGHYMLALSAWKSGDRAGATGAFDSALERDPRHLKSHLNLARVLIEDGRLEEALAHAEKVVQLDSTSSDGYRLLGQIHGELKNLELALVAYGNAILLSPRDAWSMNSMAWLLLQHGRVEESLGPLALATTIEPRNPVLLINLGTALEFTGRFTQAEGAYRSALPFASGHEKASSGLARIAGVSADSSVAPVDLKALAESYAASIRRQ